MIDLYTWPTPNGHKVHIMLEECGLDYTVHPINIGKGEQFDPDFLKISPNNRMPAIVDQDGPGGEPMSLFESGAILIYLAEKTGKFLPADTAARYDVLQWVMWQMGGVGPMFGQGNHFRTYAKEKIPYAIDRYTNEIGRLYRVLDKQLGENEYVTAGGYTIADMMIYPWVKEPERRGHTFDPFPNVKRWCDLLGARPAVERGCAVLAEHKRTGGMTDAEREVMFGATQYAKR